MNPILLSFFNLEEDEEVSIPSEAVEYIMNACNGLPYQNPFVFEVVELFFEWLATLPEEEQKTVLFKVMRYGRRSAYKPKLTRNSQ